MLSSSFISSVALYASLTLFACNHTDSSVPAPGASLGGIDFQAFCTATGGGQAVIAGDWVCDLNGARRPANANTACRLQYPAANAHAEVARPGDALSYTCYAGIQNELGGMNLQGYCASVGAPRAGVVAGHWSCIHTDSSNTAIDMTAACRFSYPLVSGAVSRQVHPGNLTSWVCLRP